MNEPARVVQLPRRDPPPLEPLYSAEQLAERWGMPVDTIYRIPAAHLPYTRVGPKRGARRYRLQEIEAYEQSGMVTGD